MDKESGRKIIPCSSTQKKLFLCTDKLVPLSDQIFDGVPRLAINLSTPMTQELESIDGTTSIWMALVVKQVNKNAQRFSELLRIVT